MNLPSDFQFSQGNLQDFVDCRRRFQLRYVRELAWPAIVADPALDREQHLQLGIQFHRMVQQHQLGIAEESLTPMAVDPELSRWWQHYLSHGPTDLPQRRHPERVLSAPLGGRRIVAKYDLLAIEPGQRAVIVDWKTGRKRPEKRWLGERLQTRVYRYLLVKTGAHLNDGVPFEPDQVEMLYWFANAPELPERFPYDALQFEQDEAFLTELVNTIQQLGKEEFPLTDKERHCRFCTYRSLCGRGNEAGSFDAAAELDFEDDVELELDLEHIMEIEF